MTALPLAALGSTAVRVAHCARSQIPGRRLADGGFPGRLVKMRVVPDPAGVDLEAKPKHLVVDVTVPGRTVEVDEPLVWSVVYHVAPPACIAIVEDFLRIARHVSQDPSGSGLGRDLGPA